MDTHVSLQVVFRDPSWPDRPLVGLVLRQTPLRVSGPGASMADLPLVDTNMSWEHYGITEAPKAGSSI